MQQVLSLSEDVTLLLRLRDFFRMWLVILKAIALSTGKEPTPFTDSPVRYPSAAPPICPDS